MMMIQKIQTSVVGSIDISVTAFDVDSAKVSEHARELPILKIESCVF